MRVRLVLVLCLACALVAPALAHEGHAGPRVTVMKTKAALKALLPEGAKLSKRKQRLPEAALEAVQRRYGSAPAGGLITYYLARDRQDGHPLAAAIVQQTDYRHGKLRVAVGLDPQHRLTGAAVLLVNEKYLPDLQRGPGTGLLADYAGMSLETLLQRREAATGEAERAVLDALAEGALRLAAALEASR